MSKSEKNVERVRTLLAELLKILESQNEMNWIRGVRAALRELSAGSASDSVDGFENAKYIYNTMTSGGRGFAEYFIWDSNESNRIHLNKRLDEIRDALWKEFDF